jgi:hypothetical protein
MISQGGLSGTWTVTTTSPSSLGVPAFARELLILTRCNQAADVGVSGLTGGVIILCNSGNNESNSGTLWIKRNIEGRDLANSFVISGTGNGGASFVEMYVIGYR